MLYGCIRSGWLHLWSNPSLPLRTRHLSVFKRLVYRLPLNGVPFIYPRCSRVVRINAVGLIKKYRKAEKCTGVLKNDITILLVTNKNVFSCSLSQYCPLTASLVVFSWLCCKVKPTILEMSWVEFGSVDFHTNESWLAIKCCPWLAFIVI